MKAMKMFIHPEDAALVFEQARKKQVDEEDYLINYQFRIVSKNEEIKWVENYSKTIQYEGKNAILGTYIDITNKKQIQKNLKEAEKKLIESEQKFRSISENSQLGINVFQDDVFKYVNQAYSSIIGYSVEELLNFQPHEMNKFIHPEDAIRLLERAKSRQAGNVGEYPNYSYRIITKNKEIKWINLFSKTIKYGGRNASLASVIDITDRKKAEEALKESEKLHRITLSSISDAVFVTDDTGSFIYISPNVSEIFGYSPQVVEKLGNIKELIGDGHFTNNELKKENEIRNIEINIRDNQKKHHDLLMNVKVVSIKEGTILYTFREITKRKEMEEIIIQSQKLEAVGKLVGGISHDFNNLLTLIMGQSELLLHSLDPVDQDKREYVQEILNACERSKHLTGTILTFTKKGYIQPQVINVGDAINEIQPLLTMVVKDRVKLVINVDTSLTSQNPVYIDKKQLEQVLLNLSINAFEAMPGGGVLTIGISGYNDSKGNHLNINVTDTGAGIDDDIFSEIFEPFYTTKETGAGLGLYTSNEIIKSYNGHISVKSLKGEGSIFTVSLPVSQSSVTKEQTSKTVKSSILNPMTILLVDDEEKILKPLAQRLHLDGHKVLTASNGFEALKIIEKFSDNINLLITDIVMPEMNGIELIMSMKEMQLETKILIISGFAEEKVTTEDVSNIGFLAKPFDYKALINTISEIKELN